MKTLRLLMIFLVSFSLHVRVRAVGVEAIVVEVRKSIPLTKDEVPQKNYFIHGGPNIGLTPGTVVDVTRRVPVHNSLLRKSIGDLHVKVAEVEIMFADGEVSVARLLDLNQDRNKPLLDYETVMVGDRLDLSTLRIPASEDSVASADE